MTTDEHKLPPFGADRDCRFAARYALMLQPFISTEETRYYLNGIFVTPHPRGYGVILVATNGHTLGLIHDKDGYTNGDWICPLPKPIVQGIKSGNTDTEMKGQQVDRQLHFAGRFGYLVTGNHTPDKPAEEAASELIVKTDAVAIDGTYPDFTRAIPKAVIPAVPGAFDASLVSDFAKVATLHAKSSGSASIMRILSGGVELAAAVIIQGLPEFTGVIMPMRAGIATDPTWTRPSFLDAMGGNGPTLETEAAE